MSLTADPFDTLPGFGWQLIITRGTRLMFNTVGDEKVTLDSEKFLII
jgi:hypothetical protein